MPTSARVGVGLSIMDSSMLVATMTGLPRLRQPCTILLCQYGTCTHLHLVTACVHAVPGNATHKNSAGMSDMLSIIAFLHDTSV